jgi:hypothetical protein
MPQVVVNTPYDRPDKALPDYDTTKLVVPPSNLPFEKAVQLLWEKVFSQKDQEKLLKESDLQLGGTPGPVPTQEERDKADELDEKNRKTLDKDGHL